MERRRFKRVNFTLHAEIVLKDNNYKGIIENLSEKGLFKIVIIEKDLTDFVPGATPEVKFQIPSGDTLNLNCNIVWVRIDKEPDGGLRYNMGLEIISPPPEYIEFVGTL